MCLDCGSILVLATDRVKVSRGEGGLAPIDLVPGRGFGENSYSDVRI
jgi:hypothetical protein